MKTDLLSILLDMRAGQVVSNINEKFNELLKAVLESGGKGELNIKLMVKPSKFAIGGAVVEVETDHECKMKKPELALGKSLFFVTKDGILSRTNPEQDAMFAEPTTEEKSNGRRTE